MVNAPTVSQEKDPISIPAAQSSI